jgi:hypothetical protein
MNTTSGRSSPNPQIPTRVFTIVFFAMEGKARYRVYVRLVTEVTKFVLPTSLYTALQLWTSAIIKIKQGNLCIKNVYALSCREMNINVTFCITAHGDNTVGPKRNRFVHDYTKRKKWGTLNL